MSSASTKIIQAAAGNAGEALYVEDVFSTYLYEGNGSTKTITNGIDLAGEGGLVWIKRRDSAANHALFDTERGAGKAVESSTTASETTSPSGDLNGFNSNGFSLGSNFAQNVNTGSTDYVSWTFRKDPKFFDVVTYSGNSVNGRQIPHSLNSAPGFIIVKCLTNTGSFISYHRGALTKVGYLNRDGAFSVDNGTFWGNGSSHIAPTSTHFTVSAQGDTNETGQNYVAYLFAHNDGDGEFGENADQDIIKCGSFTFASNQTTVNIGFEPQWLLAKRTDDNGDWIMFDAMRGFTANSGGGIGRRLLSNSSAAETTNDGLYYKSPTSIGLNLPAYGDYIYIAIRRGPMKTPESGTEVFATDIRTSAEGEGKYTSGFPVDFSLANNYDAVGNTFAGTRLTNAHLQTNSTTAESSSASDYEWDYNDGISIGASGAFFGSSKNVINYMFRRAPGFFDVVAYEGTSASLTLDHNLGVAPELVIMRRRDATANWAVSLPGHTQYAYLNLSNAAGNGSLVTSTSSTQMTIIGDSDFNISGSDAIAYLFATLPGVSKVGSYSGTGASQDIDCGFSNGARFVLLKETNGTSSWIVLDSERGINAGNDPILALNNTNAQYSGDDFIDPLSSGFTLAGTPFNGTGEEYIFLAIA